MIRPSLATAAVLSVPLLALACASSRSTTTERSAIEQALLSQSAEAALGQLSVRGLEGMTYTVDDSRAEAIDEDYTISYLERRLIESGLHPAPEEANADVIVHVSIANAGVDDAGWSIGLPEIPVSVPGAGSLAVPEVVILGREVQHGRTRLNVYGLDAETREPLFVSDMLSAQRSYVRWRALFILSLKQTDLAPPFGPAPDPES